MNTEKRSINVLKQKCVEFASTPLSFLTFFLLLFTQQGMAQCNCPSGTTVITSGTYNASNYHNQDVCIPTGQTVTLIRQGSGYVRSFYNCGTLTVDYSSTGGANVEGVTYGNLTFLAQNMGGSCHNWEFRGGVSTYNFGSNGGSTINFEVYPGATISDVTLGHSGSNYTVSLVGGGTYNLNQNAQMGGGNYKLMNNGGTADIKFKRSNNSVRLITSPLGTTNYWNTSSSGCSSAWTWATANNNINSQCNIITINASNQNYYPSCGGGGPSPVAYGSEVCGDGIDNDYDGVVDEGCIVDVDGDGVDDSVDTDPSDPCVPAQPAGYTGYDSTNSTWAAADCDGDGLTNGAEHGTSDPYDPCDPNPNVLVCPTGDYDGDGVPNGTDTAPSDPCIPIQSPGYSGYDATNSIWAADDCDGDGDTNGAEAGTSDPYCDKSTLVNPAGSCTCSAGVDAPNFGN